MQILIIYHSVSGNTRRLAEHVARGAAEVQGCEVLIKDAATVTPQDFAACDALIAGSPVYFGGMAWQLKKVFDECVTVRKQMEGKPGAAFVTGGSPAGGSETTQMAIIQALLINGMLVLGDPLSATGHYGTACLGNPDEAAGRNAALLGQRVAELTLRLKA